MIWALLFSSALAAEPARFQDCADCPVMIRVPAGTFMMGADEAETKREAVPQNGDNERPVRKVSIAQPFAIGAYEITLAQFRRFIAATGHAPERGCTVFVERKFELQADKAWDNPGFAQREDEPVLCVGWVDAKSYADWLAAETGKLYRLLSEAEWEYAARAGTKTARFWGDGLENACIYSNVADTDFMAWAGHMPASPNRFPCADGFTHAAPVGSFKANAFGLHDMLGNVLEWTADCYTPTHEGANTDADCFRTAKGGGWPNRSLSVRAAWRVGGGDHLRNDHLGFRVGRDVHLGSE